ncbi:MAG TPA: glycosyltransferase family 9 protein [Stellaceae bacterium]|nr:glycosyltransferase family 9 protein [Stellaceae bacterium]
MTPAGVTGRPRILVIKLGALGDIVQALGPAAAIRRHHGDAEIVLLTTAPFAGFLAKAPYFDAVWIDERPGPLDLVGLLRLRRRLRAAAFLRVYDLQTSARTNWYFRLLGSGSRPEWSGIARRASHAHDNPARNAMHTLDRQAEQLRRAGIPDVPWPDLSWVHADLERFRLPGRFVVMVPGGAPHRPAKRWPVERYAALAAAVVSRGAVPVVIGGPAERGLAAAISAACPMARDLTGETDLVEVAALGRRALWAVGNDTGPVHLLVAAGAPATVLYSAASDPALTAPRGPRVSILQSERLRDLGVEEVAATLAFG